ncbi:hypothetical protein AC26_3352 [Escherichia coli 1-176-05_S3_C2]|nr:hypothetical protein AC26_3352 [Escherichia coli 1-176-05_S3_C2]
MYVLFNLVLNGASRQRRMRRERLIRPTRRPDKPRLAAHPARHTASKNHPFR